VHFDLRFDLYFVVKSPAFICLRNWRDGKGREDQLAGGQVKESASAPPLRQVRQEQGPVDAQQHGHRSDSGSPQAQGTAHRELGGE